MKFYSLIFCIFFYFINCKDEYVPVLIWTGSKVSQPPVPILNKINSNAFANYLDEIFMDRKVFLVLFVEPSLSKSDFEKFDENFRFLNDTSGRVNFLRHVECPYEAIQKFCSRGYAWKDVQTDWEVSENDSGIFAMEFRDVNDRERENYFKNHEEIMKRVTEMLKIQENNWICIYTARHSRPNPSQQFKQMPWQEDREASVVSLKPLYLYEDRTLGFGLLTKGPIFLYLPNGKNHTVKALEEYIGASATVSGDAMDFILWFSNYTLNFSMFLLNKEWLIEYVSVQNENGQILKLWPKIQIYSNKCFAKFEEFQSRGQPLVKVVLTQEIGHSCTNTYTIPALCFIMFASIASISFLWGSILSAFRMPRSKNKNNISSSVNFNHLGNESWTPT